MVHFEKLVRLGFKLTVDHETLRRRVNEISMDQKKLNWDLFVLAKYVGWGERVFRVEPGLARLLIDTSVPNITGDKLRLPFPALYLEFPGKYFLPPKFDFPFIGCYLVDVRPALPYIAIDFVIEPTKRNAGSEFCCHINLKVTDNQPVDWKGIYDVLIEEWLNDTAVSKSQLDFVRGVSRFFVELMPFIINAMLYATSASPEITEQVAATTLSASCMP